MSTFNLFLHFTTSVRARVGGENCICICEFVELTEDFNFERQPLRNALNDQPCSFDSFFEIVESLERARLTARLRRSVSFQEA